MAFLGAPHKKETSTRAGGGLFENRSPCRSSCMLTCWGVVLTYRSIQKKCLRFTVLPPPNGRALRGPWLQQEVPRTCKPPTYQLAFSVKPALSWRGPQWACVRNKGMWLGGGPRR